MGTNRTDLTQHSIGIDEPTPQRVVIPAAQIIQGSLLIVDVSTIAEGIQLAQRVLHGAGHAVLTAPCIVVVFYNDRTGAVKDGDDISLIIVCIGIDNSVEFDQRRTALRVIEEVQRVGTLLHAGYQVAVQRVLGRGRNAASGNNLSDTQTVMIVLILDGGAALRHLLELATGLPGVRPRAVVRQVANGVMGQRGAVVARQNVLPAAGSIVIDIAADIRIVRNIELVEPRNVSAAIKVIAPDRTLMGIVYPEQLAEGIVCVEHRRAVSSFACDVSAAVVGVGQREIALRNGFYHLRSAARAITTVHIAVLCGEGAAVYDGALLDATQVVIGIDHLPAGTVERNLLDTIVVVVGIGGLMRTGAGFFTKANKAVLDVVVKLRALDQSIVRLAQLTTHRAIGKVAIRLEHTAKRIISHNADIAVRTVFVCVAVTAITVVFHTRLTIETVIGIEYILRIAIRNLGEQTAAVAPVGILGQFLSTDRHFLLATKRVILEVVGHIKRIGGGVVGDALDPIYPYGGIALANGGVEELELPFDDGAIFKLREDNPLQPTLRRFGHVIELHGEIQPTKSISGSTTYYPICTLPAAYAPHHDVIVLQQGSNQSIWIEYYLELLVRALEAKKERERRREHEKNEQRFAEHDEMLEQEKKLALIPLTAAQTDDAETIDDDDAASGEDTEESVVEVSPAESPPLCSKAEYIQKVQFFADACKRGGGAQRMRVLLSFMERGIKQFSAIDYKNETGAANRASYKACLDFLRKGLVTRDTVNGTFRYTLAYRDEDDCAGEAMHLADVSDSDDGADRRIPLLPRAMAYIERLYEHGTDCFTSAMLKEELEVTSKQACDICRLLIKKGCVEIIRTMRPMHYRYTGAPPVRAESVKETEVQTPQEVPSEQYDALLMRLDKMSGECATDRDKRIACFLRKKLEEKQTVFYRDEFVKSVPFSKSVVTGDLRYAANLGLIERSPQRMEGTCYYEYRICSTLKPEINTEGLTDGQIVHLTNIYRCFGENDFTIGLLAEKTNTNPSTIGFHMANLHERGLLHMERRGGHPSLYRLMVTPESHPECFTQSNDEPKRLSDAETSGMTRSEYAATISSPQRSIAAAGAQRYQPIA